MPHTHYESTDDNNDACVAAPTNNGTQKDQRLVSSNSEREGQLYTNSSLPYRNLQPVGPTGGISNNRLAERLRERVYGAVSSNEGQNMNNMTTSLGIRFLFFFVKRQPKQQQTSSSSESPKGFNSFDWYFE